MLAVARSEILSWQKAAEICKVTLALALISHHLLPFTSHFWPCLPNHYPKGNIHLCFLYISADSLPHTLR